MLAPEALFADEALLFAVPLGLFGAGSVGVGGVMVVVGASETLLAIDLGDVVICGRLWRL